jgi:hypothetical protein
MPVRCTCHLPPHPHRRPAPTLTPCFAQLATHSSSSSTTFPPFSPTPSTLPPSLASPRRPHPYTHKTNAHVCGRPGRVARAHEGGQAAQVSRRVRVRESQIVQARRVAHRAGDGTGESWKCPIRLGGTTKVVCSRSQARTTHLAPAPTAGHSAVSTPVLNLADNRDADLSVRTGLLAARVGRADDRRRGTSSRMVSSTS